MTITCPSCRQTYTFATVRLQGKDRMATCGKCGHKFPVRLLAGGPSTPARAPAANPASSKAPSTRTGSTKAAPGPSARGREMTAVGRQEAGGEQRPAPHVRIALTVLEGPEKDRVFLLTQGATVIGRTQGDILVSDPRVSSRHAQVELTGGEVWLRDLGSTNGTFVNGQPTTAARLTHLDEVTLGATRFLYTYIEDFASAYEAFSPEV